MIISCELSDNIRLVLVSLSDCSPIKRLLSGHNISNPKSVIALYCRYLLLELFGTTLVHFLENLILSLNYKKKPSFLRAATRLGEEV